MWPPEHSSLRMEGLALRVRLGCSEEERSSPQEVRVSVEFRFKQAPVAMDSDSLEETICYGRVAEALRRLEQREFRLIERLGAAAYAEAREAAGRTGGAGPHCPQASSTCGRAYGRSLVPLRGFSVICFIGLGSNLGDRRRNLEKAAAALKAVDPGLTASPLFESLAMVPGGAPDSWRKPFKNGVVRIDWKGTAPELLGLLKKIEGELGRVESPRWAPRLIDLDLLYFGGELEEEGLRIPHPGAWSRSFVLDPLKQLEPGFVPPLERQTCSPAPGSCPGALPSGWGY
jgi:2-amino-4-hydroxy-6-hydroxymethyldihydropteridine diphosphokinase/dihydroneopterin aldolase